ncbi:hypothetical protein [Bacillus mycoides]|uniref:hypothetical protein n=1 Tax=Bacillus mycoides TaxID=1405 RepID=UPI0025A086FA|nr:hypothetical protein [Bacillus mycoides]MDM5429080.1 hypothetical protein [Bacillus mycoides]
MDLKKWFSNNKWVYLAALYIIAMIFQYRASGIKFITTAAGIGLLIALLGTILTNVKSIKRVIRKIKYFMGFGMFKWDAQATFTVRYTDFKSVQAEEENIIKILSTVLKENEIKVNQKSIDPSYGKQRNLKLLVTEYVLSLDVSFSDAEMTDDDDFALGWLKVNALATLRYKDSNKAIHDVLLDFYRELEKKYSPTEQKFSITIEPKDLEKNFMKKHFINEYTPDEITSFNIICKGARSREVINEKNITFITNRREELHHMVKNAILRLS